MGFEVFGIDISPTHVKMVKNTLPNVNVDIGDAEDLQFPNNNFDVVYCFRSTWYFTNLIKSISEMLRVVKNDGVVFFDIQNSQHPIHRKFIREQKRRTDHYLYHITSKYIRNFIKLMIIPIKYYGCDWSLRKNIIIGTPTDPSIVNHYLLQEEDINYKIYGVNWNKTFTLKVIEKTDELYQFDRLVYRVKKEVN